MYSGTPDEQPLSSAITPLLKEDHGLHATFSTFRQNEFCNSGKYYLSEEDYCNQFDGFQILSERK
jgi:hypothetical protein